MVVGWMMLVAATASRASRKRQIFEFVRNGDFLCRHRNLPDDFRGIAERPAFAAAVIHLGEHHGFFEVIISGTAAAGAIVGVILAVLIHHTQSEVIDAFVKLLLIHTAAAAFYF